MALINSFPAAWDRGMARFEEPSAETDTLVFAVLQDDQIRGFCQTVCDDVLRHETAELKKKLELYKTVLEQHNIFLEDIS